MNNHNLNQPQIWRQVFKDRVFAYSLRLIIVVFFITAAFLLYKWNRLPPVVPLFYSLPWGEEQLTSPWGLWGLWLGLLLTNLFNFVLGGWLYRQSKYLAHLLWIASLVLTGLGVLTIFKIIFLVG